MFQTLRDLTKHSIIYGLGRVLSKLLGFVLLPIYTRHLTPNDYGILSLLTVTNSVASMIAQWGMGSALFREVIYCEKDKSKVESTALYFLMGESALFFGVLLLLSPQISNLIFDSSGYTYLLRLTFLSGFLQIIQVVFMARLRSREQSSLYAAVSVSSFLVGAALNIYFVAVLRRGVEGLTIATLTKTILFTFVYLAFLIRDLELTFSFSLLRSMLRFGAPLVPGNLASFAMTSAEQYFLQRFATTSDVGLYSLGYKIGLGVNLVVQAIQLAWPAQMFEIMKEPDAERQFAKILTYYLAGLGFISLALSVLAREMLILMTTPKFYSAAVVVPLVVVSYVLYGIRFMTNMGLFKVNKTQYASLVIFGTALLHLGLNYWLVPTYGMMGAAWATVTSYGILAVCSVGLNLYFWHIPYEYGRIVKIGLAWGLVHAASLLTQNFSTWLSIGVKSALLLAYPLLLYVLHFYQEKELDVLKDLTQSGIKRVRAICYQKPL
jgi:O-antigen/teichoic acid export membrane protein